MRSQKCKSEWAKFAGPVWHQVVYHVIIWFCSGLSFTSVSAVSFISLKKAMFPIMVGSMNENDSWSKIITAKSSSKDPQQTVFHLFHLKLNAV